jgi:hypothetical protein
MSVIIPNEVPSVGFYYHYKHKDEQGIYEYAYEVLGTGRHTEDITKEGFTMKRFTPIADESILALLRSKREEMYNK